MFFSLYFLGNVLASEVEEARLLLDTAERARRHVDAEVVDVREAMSTVNTANSIIATDKRRLDGDLRGIQQELDDLMNQIKNSEEKTKKALSDAGESVHLSFLRYSRALRTAAKCTFESPRTSKPRTSRSISILCRVL